LGSSLNIPAVAALHAVGLETGLDFVSRMGIDNLGDPGQYGLSFALGGGAVSLLDLTSAYSVFGNGGWRLEPTFIEEIVAAGGRRLFAAAPPSPRRVLDERVAWLISDILSDNQARTPAFGSNSVLRLDRAAAVKTGTTNNFHDNWTVGYTPELVVGVWVGNANNAPMVGVTGVSGAGPIWHRAMRAFLAGEPETGFTQPPGLVRVEVCRLSGFLPTEVCPYRRWEWFLAGTQPVAYDTFFRRLESGAAAGEIVLDLPPEFHTWAREQGWPLLVDLKPSERRPPAPAEAGLRFLYPDPGAVFYLSSALPPEAQRILLQVAGGEPYGQVTVWLDERPLAVISEPPYQLWWQLEPGEHQLYLSGVAAGGQRVTGPITAFTVRGGESGRP
jgi:membrane peptidoglycan carboxypeptidase